MNFKNLKSPFVIILVGTPLSGKSTWVRKALPDVKVISRDNIIMSLSDTDNYTESFRKVDQKKVDKILKEELETYGKSKENVVIDMTHMRPKRRIYNLSYFKNHYKIAVVFPILSEKEYKKRNEKRNKEENKYIDYKIVESMISRYTKIESREGFDKVIYL